MLANSPNDTPLDKQLREAEHVQDEVAKEIASQLDKTKDAYPLVDIEEILEKAQEYYEDGSF